VAFVAGQLMSSQLACVDVVAGLVGTLAVEVTVLGFDLAFADMVEQTIWFHNVLRIEGTSRIICRFDHCREVKIVAGVLFDCRNLDLSTFA
jgi:hypothetical protein